MHVADIMTAKVITVAAETPVTEVARLMLQHRISGLPVIAADGAVIGIVTEGDLLRRAETGTERRHLRWLELLIAPGRLAREYASANARKAGEVMSPGVVSVAPDDPLERVVTLMERHRIKRLPVIDGARLVGIVSRANLVRALVHNRPRSQAAEKAPSDIEIREQILAEIAKQPWGPRAGVDVRVTAGEVELRGAITDERERTALHVLVENTPGVTAMRDQLVWIEPLSGYAIPSEDMPHLPGL